MNMITQDAVVIHSQSLYTHYCNTIFEYQISNT